MKIAHFKKILAGNNAVRISDDLIIFNDFELYSLETGESKNYKTLEELLANNKDVEKLIEDAPYFELRWDGGRGSSSHSEGKMGFGHAPHGGKDGTKDMLNAELNFNTAQGNSLQAVLGRFKDKYGKAEHEYGAAIDEQGFVHSLRDGNKHNVSYKPGSLDNMTVVHNHPSGSNFSDTDLITAATTKSRGVVATSSNAKNLGKTYHFQKNQNFKAKEFVKALRNAEWPEKLGYDKGADWWLKKNQRAFGYKYSSNGLI